MIYCLAFKSWQTYEGDRHPDTGTRHGHGRAVLPNGDQFEGEYVDGQRHGEVIHSFMCC